MDYDRLPVVKLTEQSLRRIKEKLGKSRDDKQQDNATPKKGVMRAPKFEVYRPGVSRLSNRNIAFDSSDFAAGNTVKLSSSESNEKTSSKSESDGRKKERKGAYNNETKHTRRSDDRKHTKQKLRNFEGKLRSSYSPGGERNNMWKKTGRPKKAESPPPQQRFSSADSYDEEEGFLARHERRRKRRGYLSDSSNSEHEHSKQRMGSDDEFIWDDYHGDFLKTWPNDGFSMSAVSDEITIPSEKPEHDAAKKDSGFLNSEKIEKTPESDSDRAIDDEPFARGDRAENPERGLIKRKTEDVLEEQKSVKDTRKQLFNPDNPDIPIMVRPNLRDKKIKAKSQNSEGSRAVAQETRLSASQSYTRQANYRSNDSLGRCNQPTSIPVKYAAHPDHWNPPVSTDFPEYEHDKNVDHDDVLSSGVGDLSDESHEKLLKDAESLETTINTLLANRTVSTKNFNEKLQVSRTQLKQIHKTLILHHIEVSTKHNVEQVLWKTVYHQLMEQLRKRTASATGDEKNDLINLLIVVLDQATEFYENLLMRLQQIYKIKLKELFASVSSMKQFQKRIGKRTKLALMTCHRSLICLGDISRYKENANETSNFGRARQYYMQARAIEPRNGRPYNQLALLAVQTRRKLDAIYYYARSLATLGNPILTARENLIALFDDARRKYQKWEGGSANEKEAKTADVPNEEKITNRRPSAKSRLIWLLPGKEEYAESSDDLTAEPLSEKQNGESPITAMTAGQLLRHFLLVFNHVHGKLFTRVGLDSFEKLQQHLLDLFHKVLSKETILISKQTLQYIFAINFFTVFDQHQRIKSAFYIILAIFLDKCQTKSFGMNTLLLYRKYFDCILKFKEPTGAASTWLSIQAVQLAFSMIAILTREVTTHLTHLPIQAGQFYDPTQSSQLSILLPSLKISYDWMYCNKNIWYPQPPAKPSNPQHDIWASIAELSDWLIGDYKAFPMRIFSQTHHNREEVCLSEDFEFSGFAPLLNLDNESRYVLISDYASPDQRSRACECVRLDLIRDFLEYLCGMEDPLLAFKQGRYVVLVKDVPLPEEVKPRLSSAEEVVSEMLEDASIADDVIEENARNDDADLCELRALRNTLQQTKQDHDKRKDQIIASLEASTDSDAVYVKPQNLIPDTNCFIDHLPYIDALTKTGVYTVYVPLVVITELHGLAQESKSGDDHAVKVYNRASSAVEFLQRKFSTERDVKLQALTNQGSILHTISFQSQSDASSKATNDDLILQCCVKFEERQPRQPKSVMKTVLLSDDRNLRVKALARNMPTKALQEFCKWADVAKS